MTKNDCFYHSIRDFGEQWLQYQENTGYYGSADSLDSLLAPLLDSAAIKGKRVADVGAGTGRYTRLFHEAGASSILAIEPSKAFEVLKRNTADLRGIEYLQATAEKIPNHAFDLVFCIGVLQFIFDPRPELIAMGRALAPGGRLFLWVYGKENNRLYLALLRPLRSVTCRLPHGTLDRLAGLLTVPVCLYAWACRFFCLPMADYLRDYFSRLDRYSRKLVIYDQLNPRYCIYYRRDELRYLLETCGFTDIQIHHRLGYSWSVLARYSEEESP